MFDRLLTFLRVGLSEVGLDELGVELDGLVAVLQAQVERHQLRVARRAVRVNLGVRGVSPVRYNIRSVW